MLVVRVVRLWERYYEQGRGHPFRLEMRRTGLDVRSDRPPEQIVHRDTMCQAVGVRSLFSTLLKALFPWTSVL